MRSASRRRNNASCIIAPASSAFSYGIAASLPQIFNGRPIYARFHRFDRGDRAARYFCRAGQMACAREDASIFLMHFIIYKRCRRHYRHFQSAHGQYTLQHGLRFSMAEMPRHIASMLIISAHTAPLHDHLLPAIRKQLYAQIFSLRFLMPFTLTPPSAAISLNAHYWHACRPCLLRMLFISFADCLLIFVYPNSRPRSFAFHVE